jgi:hypothetical protein
MINISGRLGDVSSYSLGLRNITSGFRDINAPFRINEYEKMDSGFSFNSVDFDFDKYIPLVSINYSKIPGSVHDRLSKADHIISLNDYTHDMLLDSGFDNSLRFNMPILSSNKNLLIKEKKHFNFLSVLNLDKCYEWEKIIRCFYKTFDQCNDVSMIVKINYSNDFSIYSQSKIMRKILSVKKDYPNSADIIFLGSKMSDYDFSSLFNSADCFVKLEGIDMGMSMMNAIASNMVCIGPSTGLGGSLLKRYGGLMIDKESSVKNISDPFMSGALYDTYSEKHLCEAMKYVFFEYDKVKEKNLKNRKAVSNEYSIKNAVNNIVNIQKYIFG